MTAHALVQKLWNYCSILRDDGLSFLLHGSYGGQDGLYVEQLTYLLFLKMAKEQSRLSVIDALDTLASASRAFNALFPAP